MGSKVLDEKTHGGCHEELAKEHLHAQQGDGLPTGVAVLRPGSGQKNPTLLYTSSGYWILKNFHEPIQIFTNILSQQAINHKNAPI